MIHQLTYRSKATLILLPQDVEDILRMSRYRNSLKDITGCMVFKNGFFLQLLEGEKGDVKGLFDKIEYDRRHNEVVVLSEGRTTKRAFAMYHMAHFEIPASSGNKVGEAIGKELKKYITPQDKPSFTMNVFVYNVKQLFLREGFYRF